MSLLLKIIIPKPNEKIIIPIRTDSSEISTPLTIKPLLL